MTRRSSGGRSPSSLDKHAPTASEMNSKLESDYNSIIERLQSQRRRQSSDEAAAASDGRPTTITPEKCAADQEEEKPPPPTPPPHESEVNTQRICSTPSRSSKSGLTTTQKMQAALSSGVVASSPWESQMTGLSVTPSLVDTKDCDSTLPTFESVGDWHDDVASGTLFLVSNGSGDSQDHRADREDVDSSLQSKTMIMFTAASDRFTASEKESRRRLHYKEKLRALTDELTTSSAVDRSREMLSSIKDKSNGMLQKKRGGGDQGVARDGRANNGDATYKLMYENMKNKLCACSLPSCVDDAVVDHEGLIISVPEHGFGCRPTRRACGSIEAGAEDDSKYSDDLNDGAHSDLSSLTGATHHRYQARYW